MIPSHLIIDHTSSWLANAKKDTTTVVVSTLSGTGQALKFYKSILAPLLKEFDLLEDQDFELHVTRSAETIRNLTFDKYRRSACTVEQNIILLSGDGGISDIINCILETEPDGKGKNWIAPTINLLPMGTGNALANSSGIIGPGDRTSGLRSLVCGKPKPVPTFRVDFTEGARLLSNEGTEAASFKTTPPALYGAVVCSWGLHASLVANSDTKEYRKHGDKRFAMVAKDLVSPDDGSGPHSYKGRLTIHDKDRKTINPVVGAQGDAPTEHGYLLATFCSKLDANFTISPQSCPLDGRLMLVRFGPQSNAHEIWRLLRNGQGLLEDDPAIMYREFHSLGIQFDEEDDKWRRVCVDGTIIQIEKGGHLTVSKHEGADVARLRVLEEA